MSEARPRLLRRQSWRRVDEHTWHTSRDALLGRDGADVDLIRRVLVGNAQPDSFTVAERLTSRPLWLAEAERDGASWLRALVQRRVAAVPQLGDDSAGQHAAAHVHDEVRRLLGLPDITGAPSAETLWNQEIPYVVDRVIGHCLFGDPRTDPDPMPAVIAHSLQIVAGLLDWFADHQAGSDTAALVRHALAAGLVDLGVKGGTALCPPLDPALYFDADWLGFALVEAANKSPMVVDHLASLIAAVGHDSTRLVWFTDDVIETAFDLLTVQHLVWLNPRLRVFIAPRSRRTDNDGTYGDVAWMLRHRAFHHLAETVAIGRVQVTEHGPSMAAPRLDKLHPAVLRELDWADAVVVKGGRNDELLAGTLDRPLWTGYVITREFTEAQAGFDGRAAPLVFVHTPAGHRPWWGWRGRAHRTLAVAPDRTIAACWATVADRQRHATATDADRIATDLAWLLDSWPTLCQDYAQPGRADIRHLADRLARTSRGVPRDRDLIHRAHYLTDPEPNTRDHRPPR